MNADNSSTEVSGIIISSRIASRPSRQSTVRIVTSASSSVRTSVLSSSLISDAITDACPFDISDLEKLHFTVTSFFEIPSAFIDFTPSDNAKSIMIFAKCISEFLRIFIASSR